MITSIDNSGMWRRKL